MWLAAAVAGGGTVADEHLAGAEPDLRLHMIPSW